MSQPVLTLELPEDIYEHVRRAAKGMKQPVAKALVSIVRAATPSLEKVPRAYRAQLEAMEKISAMKRCGKCRQVAWRQPSSAAWQTFLIRTSAER